MQQEHDELLDRAAALEAEAKKLRENADSISKDIQAEIQHKVGSCSPFTETFDFQATEENFAELSNLSDDDRAEKLIEAIGSSDPTLKLIQHGYWGDFRLISNQPFRSYGEAWTRSGSPEWLEQIFPGWNEEETEAA